MRRMPKPKVDEKALAQIQGFAIRAFHARKSWNGMGAPEVQQMTIIAGLEAWVRSQGGEPGFEVELEAAVENYETIEDIE